MKDTIQKQYNLWLEKAVEDSDLKEELLAMAKNEAKIEDAFYRHLTFGTGGMRGIIGAGTNRINIYTVAKASQGLADYVKHHFLGEARKIAVSYDSRLKSELFAQVSSCVFAANEIQVFLYPELMPTPCLSFAVRELGCAAGIMITASHNPSKYNGYKVYGADGCQITTEAADEILREIEKLDIFTDIKKSDFAKCVEVGRIQYISEDIHTSFIKQVKKQTMLGKDDVVDKGIAIVYSPLNGTGRAPILRVLNECGYTNIRVVKEQETPDGHFPTCPYPNPEIKEAMALGIEYAKRYRADLLLATDPDCDRVGVAVKDATGGYTLLSGNEVGILLLDYICSRREEMKTMPKNPIAIKTIVTTDMAEQIARHYGVKTVNVLTGFKYIGEQIGLLEQRGCKDSYIFGFEESYGYLSGSYVRDKDAINGTFLICEMFVYYASKGLGLLDKLNELYATYGYCLNTLHSYEFEGASGFLKMQKIIKAFREKPASFGGKKVCRVLDYSQGIDGLPASDVLKFILEDNCSFVIRPSGTEPKLKVYVSVSAECHEKARKTEEQLVESLSDFFR